MKENYNTYKHYFARIFSNIILRAQEELCVSFPVFFFVKLSEKP